MPDQPALHPLDDALRLDAVSPGVSRGRTTPPYANMVGPYGGVTAAVMMQAVLQHEELLGEPIALTVNFAAAVSDGDFEVHAHPSRTNRSTQHWSMELIQEGKVAATATAVTASHRDTWTDTEAVMPSIPAPEEIPAGSGAPMEWPRRYEMRFAEGEFRVDGQRRDSSQTRLWVRDAPPRPLDFASLTALSDVFFPRVYVRRGEQIPIGTVTLTTYFHADGSALAEAGDDYLLGTVRGAAFQRGFYDHSAQLWSRGGVLLASTHQLVYYKG